MRLSPSGTDRARADWLREVTYAHRGLHGDGRLENSPSAFRAAVAAGYGIECDVQMTADDEAAVFHDFELDRLTDQTGPVRERSLEMLKTIPLKGGDPIWALADLLSEIAGQVPLLVEIKSRRELDPAPLCAAVDRALCAYSGAVAVMSFDPRVPNWFFTNAPGVVRGLVVTEEDDRGVAGRMRRRIAFRHARPDFLAYDVRDLPSSFAAAHRARGLPLLTWTVRTPELRARAVAYADAPIAEGAGLA